MTSAEILISVFLILNFLAIVSLCFFSYKLTRSQIKMVTLSRRSQDHLASMAATAVGLKEISERMAANAKQSSEIIQDVLAKSAEWMKTYVGNSDAIMVRSVDTINLHGARVEELLVKSAEQGKILGNNMAAMIKEAADHNNGTITTIEKLLSGVLKMAESQVHSTKGLEMAITAYTRMSFGVGGNQEKLSPLDEISTKEELRAFMQSSGLPRSAAEREMQRRSVYDDGMRVDED